MKKIAVFIILAAIFSSQSFAAEPPTLISIYSLPFNVERFHGDALDSKAAIYKAQTASSVAASEAENIDTEGRTVINNKTGEESYETFDDLTALTMTLKKYLVPVQKENLAYLSTMNHEALVNQLGIAATSAFQNLVLADLKIDSTQIGLKMAQLNFEQAKNRLASGELTALEYGFERYKLMAAEVAYDNAQLAYDNAQRWFNLSVGFDVLSSDYTLASKLYGPIVLESLEFYTERALNERLSLESIGMKQSETALEMRLLLESEAFDWHLETQERVIKLESDLETLALVYDLEAAKVVSQVREAYETLTIQLQEVEALKQFTEVVEANFSALKEQHDNEKGEISDYVFYVAELEFITAKQNLTAAEMKALELRRELLNVSSVGYLK